MHRTQRETSRVRGPLLLLAALVLAFAAGRAVANQPHMQNALAALQNAQSELQQATPNKGGHRERAMALVSDAITQVEAGIGFAGGD
jgi:hypothetical protein